jgi:hypothetical protein
MVLQTVVSQLCLYLPLQNSLVHATSQCYLDLELLSTRDSVRRHRLSNNKTFSVSPTLSSLKSASQTAANATKSNTTHSRTNRRTEPSPFPDLSRFLRTSTCKRTDRLLRTLTEEPRKTQSARETTPRVVLEAAQIASLLPYAHQASALASESDIEYFCL